MIVKETLQITAEFWNAMADEGCKNKEDCSKFHLVEKFENNCPLCERALDCYDCLLFDFWKEGIQQEQEDVPCNQSIYGKWKKARYKHTRSKYARMIAFAAEEKLIELGK